MEGTKDKQNKTKKRIRNVKYWKGGNARIKINGGERDQEVWERQKEIERELEGRRKINGRKRETTKIDVCETESLRKL